MSNPAQEPVDLFARAKALIAEAENAQIIDDDEKAEAATAWVGQAKTVFDTLDADRLNAGKPHRDAIANINSEYATVLEPLDVTKPNSHMKRIRGLLNGWATLVIQRQRAEEARIRQETERRAAEKAAEEERQAAAARKAAEDAVFAGRLQEAAKLNREADKKEAQAATTLEHAIETPRVAPAREIVPIHSVAGKMTAQTEWIWTIEDISKVPEQYILRTINKAAVDAAVKKNNVRSIPGLAITESAKSQIRR